jgi:hypothetical protein
MMEGAERPGYYEGNREAIWERMLHVQNEMLAEQKSLHKTLGTFGGLLFALLVAIYHQLGGALLPTWLSAMWH